MNRSRILPPAVLLYLFLFLVCCPLYAYVIPEDNQVAEILDSIVAAEEVIDSAPPPAEHTFILDITT